ncbi:MAG TPA: glycosyltransferase family 4 protein [Vicinamibacterales bacterium]|nr:glycosyltransferase family 4 protein [Vicinamibacterales bacterium]
MRILWVKMGGLWPSTTGGRVRSLQIVSALSRLHRVTLITTHGPGDDPQGLARQLCDCQQVISIPYDVPKRGSSAFPLAVARSWFSPYPVDLWKWRVPEMRDKVHERISDGSVDVCVCDFLFAAANVPFDAGVPVVLFEHNVEYLIWQRLSTLERSPWKRALFEMEWRKLRRLEADACRRADLTIAVSEEDRQRLSSLAPGATTGSIPTGVDTNYFRPAGRPEIPARLVFSGSMDWHPNEDAVLYFGESILPLIRQQVPDASFAVVGRNPTARLREAAERLGMIITGTVDDVRPYLDEASVYVVPLRAGSGTRMKIFEALGMAKPVVSTTVGAEGLTLNDGHEFIAADDPQAFADAVVALLHDEARRRALGEAGRSLVVERYSWPQVAREFEAQCEQIAGADGPDEAELADGRADMPRGRSPRHRRARVVAGVHDEAGRPRRYY